MEDDFTKRLVEWTIRWCTAHPPSGPRSIRHELHPLQLQRASDCDDAELGDSDLEPPDWASIERIPKDKTDLFFHWTDDSLEYRPAAYPVLEEVFKIIMQPELMGEIYIRCHQLLCQPISTSGFWVFLYYPGLLSRVMWTLIFYSTLMEGLRWHYRELQRRRRGAERVAMSLDEAVATADGSAVRREVIGMEDPAEQEDEDTELPDPEELFTRLTNREQEVAGLLGEGDQQTTIAELLELTPGRISELVSQLRRKSRSDPMPS